MTPGSAAHPPATAALSTQRTLPLFLPSLQAAALPIRAMLPRTECPRPSAVCGYSRGTSARTRRPLAQPCRVPLSSGACYTLFVTRCHVVRLASHASPAQRQAVHAPRDDQGAVIGDDRRADRAREQLHARAWRAPLRRHQGGDGPGRVPPAPAGACLDVSGRRRRELRAVGIHGCAASATIPLGWVWRFGAEVTQWRLQVCCASTGAHASCPPRPTRACS